MLELMFLFFTKHLIVDYFVQNKYQWSNKGNYGHLGGILHSFLHGASSSLILYFYTPYFFLLGALDMFIHYHIDWLKMNINKIKGWAANTHEQFWWLLGVDQYLHGLTYLLLIKLQEGV